MSHRPRPPAPAAPDSPLPPLFEAWFAGKGWAPHPHQRAMLEADRAGLSTLLIAPTGAGKTLAGFLPTLIDLGTQPRPGLHTLYISPLKALASDIARNLERPLAELRLPLRAETRTGDTRQPDRERQRRSPPHILMTTPESLALLLSFPDAPRIFGTLERLIVDELHALIGTKRGELLALGCARLASLAPRHRRIGLSATVHDEAPLRAWLSHTASPDDPQVATIKGRPGERPDIQILAPPERLPWGGHMGLFAMPAIYRAIAAARMAIVFVNTRAQAELCFAALWRANEAALPIALHHGSLAPEQRRRVEQAMAAGQLRAVIATSSLDLGIDWGDVDLVIQVGAPKGTARLLQRVGRSNHRLDEPSRALLVPANRFEFIECQAAIEAIGAGEIDGAAPPSGGLDVLAQHVIGTACAGPFSACALYDEVRRAAPYAALPRAQFERVIAFVATGGYALAGYERFRRLEPQDDGRLRLVAPMVAQSYRMNIGTIVEATALKVRLGRGAAIGEVEEYFASTLSAGDQFMFGGRLLEFVAIRDLAVEVREGRPDGRKPVVPVYAGAQMPLTTQLARRVREIVASPERRQSLPADVREWLGFQEERSRLPDPGRLLIEIFPRAGRWFLVAYTFEGRPAHQTLGMLITRRMERAGARPLGFVATDYVLAIWSLNEPTGFDDLFAQDMLGDDLEAWMDESSLLKRTFRNVAVIAGLIERRHPGKEKSGRQVTMNTDLIYDVLRRHDPQHLLLEATRADAARGLTDIRRVSDCLGRIAGRIDAVRLDRVSPLAVPVLLEIGRERVQGEGLDLMLDEAAEALIEEATGQAPEEGPEGMVLAPRLPPSG